MGRGMDQDVERRIGVGRVRGRRRVTMTDVARAANCSQSTVSFVLNNNMAVQISDATRERVHKIARELGYEGAQRPGGGTAGRSASRVIGFVADRLSVGWEGGPALLEGVRQAGNAVGALVLAAETENDADLEPKTLDYFMASGVDALIYACVHTRRVRLPDQLLTAQIPVFLLNCYTEDGDRPAVVPSEIVGGQTATTALIDAGHRRIATITGETYMEAASDRLTGYKRALASADIPFDDALVMPGDWSASTGFYSTQQLLGLDDPPTAIYCQNDRMAVGCYEALKEAGLRIPDDVSVVGYDDDEISRHLFPPLTTLVLPHRAMGRFVVEQYLDGVPGTAGRYRLTKLACELVERDSVGLPSERRRRSA